MDLYEQDLQIMGMYQGLLVIVIHATKWSIVPMLADFVHIRLVVVVTMHTIDQPLVHDLRQR